MVRPVRCLAVIGAALLVLGAVAAVPSTAADRPGTVGYFAYAPLPAPGAGAPDPAPPPR